MLSERTPLQSTAQADIDEIESLFSISVQPARLEVPAAAVVPERKPSVALAPERKQQQQQQQQYVNKSSSSNPQQGPSIPVSYVPPRPTPDYGSSSSSSYITGAGGGGGGPAAVVGFGSGPVYNTLTEPVWETLKRDVMRVVNNLRNVVFPNPYREDPGKPLRDWDLWGPFFFIIFMALALSYSATTDRSKVFAVVFATLSVGAIVLTLNVQLLGGTIIFLQSLSLLGYCLFPLDVGAIVCLANSSKLYRSLVVLLSLAWSSWAAYPFVSTAVPSSRKALAIYPVLLLYIAVGFLVLANN
ncbi:unnamed protein product [Sphagnum troendelagicum]|uniref:Protein YIP n=1 Tax=Sphagnum troendelagicum TaxID=128251 RepID=A0ABP0UPN8_9BRYO